MPFTSIYAGYNSLHTAVATNKEDAFKEVISHETQDIIRGYHEDDAFAQSKKVEELYDAILIDKVPHDAAFTVELLSLLAKLPPPVVVDDRVYTFRYDTNPSKVSPSQVAIIEEYIRLMQIHSSNPKNIKRRPFSSVTDKDELLIAVYCTGKGFKGEGHVDVRLQDGEELKDYLLRINGMLNIAFASSNVPFNLSQADLDTYRPIIDYIQSQYHAVLPEEALAIPEFPEEIMKVIQRITLNLPKSHRMNYSEIEEHNRLAKQALASA